MAIVPVQNLPHNYRPNPVVTLEEYATYIPTSECEMLGVANAPNAKNYECRSVWSLAQREYVKHYLSEAQEEIEAQLGWLLSADWIVGDIADERDSLMRYVDQQKPAMPQSRGSWHNSNWHKLQGVFKARWKHVLEPGIRAVTDIELGATVSHLTDPAVVVVTTAITDTNEIKAYLPGSDLEVNPSEIIANGATATISIPRCRLVKEDLQDNPPGGVDYNTIANFTDELDIKRVFTDPSVQAKLICSKCGDCTTTTKGGCIRVLNQRQGTLSVETNLNCVCGCIPEKIGLYYYAGDINTTTKVKDMVFRLSSAKMPEPPCGCEEAQRLWKRDRESPEIITREIMDNPFTMNHGGITVWKWVKAQPRILTFGSL